MALATICGYAWHEVSFPRSTLAFEIVPQLRLLAAFHSPMPPTDHDWDAWLRAAHELWKMADESRFLVVSQGGHPSNKQLARLEELKGRLERAGGRKRSEPLTAVISTSVAMRFVVAAVTLFNPRIRSFSPAAVEDAYQHLGFTADERAPAAAAIERLRVQVTASSSAA